MSKKKQPAAVPIKEAMFFPEDFAKLHQRHVIYIKEGVIIDLNRLKKRTDDLDKIKSLKKS
mgnify:CR=1 FL=1